MASPRERDHRADSSRPSQGLSRPHPPSVRPQFRRHHFHDFAPWPHRRYNDYVWVDNWGWWPRWFPYWDRGWYDYWWALYDYYGGDASPEYAEYAMDAYIRENAPQWGLVIGGTYAGRDYGRVDRLMIGAGPHGGGGHGGDSFGGHAVVPHSFGGGGHAIVPQHGGFSGHGIVPQHGGFHGGFGGHRERYLHPHDYYRDYSIFNGEWWPYWFPYWDPTWRYYWSQLYDYYGGDSQADYAQYARDAYVRDHMRRMGRI